MEENLVIKVENLYKKFSRSLKRSMAYGAADIARNMVGISVDTAKLRKSEFWSLEDINFELKKGEALGIIGQNGSGKSTLLRLINGIYPPDKGSISVQGSIGALIAVGAGFHPHMTGRENIYLNGSILGMSRKEIDQKFDEIIKFADIGDFMDAPVATYSSGMHVRLGFSIAIHSNPEILLADEILAVGDLSFTLKCYRKIAEYRRAGGSIILVSHNMQLIRNTCQNVLWIDKGKSVMYGDTQKTCDLYENFMLQKDSTEQEGVGSHVNNDPTAQIVDVKFLDKNNNPTSEFTVGEKFKARIFYSSTRKIEEPMFTIGILSAENISVVANYSNYDSEKPIDYIEGEGYIDFVIDSLLVKPATYNVTVTLTEKSLNNVLDWHEKNFSFVVKTSGKVAFGLYQPVGIWTLSKNGNEEPDTVEKYINQDNEKARRIKELFKQDEELVIFDIGSCEGEDSIRYSRAFPKSKIYAFEPLTNNYRKILNNLKKYSVNNVKTYNFALSDKTGDSEFYVSSGHPENKDNSENWDYGNKSSSLLPPEEVKEYYNWLKFNEKISIKTKTLDIFCKQEKIKNIDFIHMDVQGAELMVLNGARENIKNIKAIMLEFSNVKLYKDQPLYTDVLEFMKKNNFSELYSETYGIAGDSIFINNNFK